MANHQTGKRILVLTTSIQYPGPSLLTVKNTEVLLLVLNCFDAFLGIFRETNPFRVSANVTVLGCRIILLFPATS